MLQNIVSGQFLSFLLKLQNAVIIMEDCEYILKRRDTHENPLINSLLNITDGLVGDALPSGWDVSVPMVQSTFDAHMWKITQTLTDGKMKFRANNSWDVNWGDNGGDIIVTAGKYDIWFNDLDGRYTFIVAQ